MDIKKLESDICSTILNFFNDNDIKYNETNITFDNMLQEWFNICDKFVSIKQRKVFFSKELQEKINSHSIDDETIRLINLMKDKFEQGHNINPYLSKNISNSTVVDKLLTMWRIHHLHLTDEMDGRMAKRSDKYILFLIGNNSVYFLDQTKHLNGKEFASRIFLSILKNNNWLNMVGIQEMSDVQSINYEISSDEELYNAWKGNINFNLFKIDDQIYCNINGLTMAGTSLDHRLKLNDFNKYLYNCSKNPNIEYLHCEIDKEFMQLKIHIKNFGSNFVITIEGD